ncbi:MULTISPECIES: hypothetical protein [unclassified Acinetobacter]|uniref:hypothetical protein n=1 Tax=unclassified Acinetobacter TaxID=196816 RepID=UPI0015D24114|nr:MULTISPECIES: hypothetical protein [unclassified Acinetobacter]
MTAEIAILNPHGVALAADSAVTIGSQKIINSAIKLFALSKTEPVGVMVYGNANLLNIPWETLIKIYRKEHAKSRFEKLENYAESFLSFLKTKTTIFNADIQNHWLEEQISFIFNFIDLEFTSQCDQSSVRGIQLTLDQKKDILLDILTRLRHSQAANEATFYEEITPIIPKIKSVGEPFINHYFQDFLTYPEVKAVLEELLILIVTNNNLFQGSTGLVISGFGDDDIFPSVITYQISGYFENNLIYKMDTSKTIINNNTGMRSGIIPFAQEDVVNSFIKGFDPELQQISDNYLNAMSEEFFKNAPFLNPVQKAQFITDFKSDLSDFKSTMDKEILDRHVNPMINMIEVLPKDELATMAETLVNITAFKRKMAVSSLETVGGPIDVAVISKGDGLVWVKRKQYFPANLNKHFFDNYFKD